MPVYEYQCPECNAVKDVFHKIEERPDVKCECGSKMDKIISTPKIVSGVGDIGAKVPSGFKDLLRGSLKNVPDRYKGTNNVV